MRGAARLGAVRAAGGIRDMAPAQRRGAPASRPVQRLRARRSCCSSTTTWRRWPRLARADARPRRPAAGRRQAQLSRRAAAARRRRARARRLRRSRAAPARRRRSRPSRRTRLAARGLGAHVESAPLSRQRRLRRRAGRHRRPDAALPSGPPRSGGSRAHHGRRDDIGGAAGAAVSGSPLAKEREHGHDELAALISAARARLPDDSDLRS